ncbi:MAG TPA: Hpt domain-containing protein [Bryobacteraceae bacterium]|jgi:HPt (histidine-containing phosphotransfer) domain-containing protein|nr:Hpt domain-containing protein [Bryobacteraceae bacterium]
MAQEVSANSLGSDMPLDSKIMEWDPGSNAPDAWVLPAALQQLQECGEESLVEELIEIFQTDTASRLELLARAVQTADYTTARQEAHTIKGSALQVGAVRFGDICRQMETEARKPEPVDLNPLFGALMASFEEVRVVLAARQSSENGGSPDHGQ